MGRPCRTIVPALAGVCAGIAAIAAVAPVGATVQASGDRPSPAATARALCSAPAGRETGTVADPALLETSGLVRSRSHAGVLWAHNDSGDSTRVFALDRRGTPLGTVTVTGADAVDWEDLALGRGPGGADHLFLGDIGGGAAGARSTVTVYRIPEPDPPGAGATTASATAQAVTLRYPDGAHDAEALLVDDRTGDLVVITKGTTDAATVYRAPGGATAARGTTITVEPVGELARPVTRDGARVIQELAGLAGLADRVAGADAAPDAGIAVVRTYGGVAVHRWPATRSLAQALLTRPCAAPAPADLRFPQGEAIALAPDGLRYLTVAEGANAPLIEVRARRP
ncbi:MAG: hypothetical protein WDA60_06685 [Acidimicrobiia bacterium]|jgi:hypothetical protein